METPTGTLTDTLMERVGNLIPTDDAPIHWGHPLLSTTPRSVAIEALAIRMAALENAVRAITLELQNLSTGTS